MAGTRPTHAMVFAAGLGKRMRPLTDNMPKPMVPVNGRPLIDYALDGLADAGVETAVVNVHYRPEPLERYLSERQTPRIVISDERDQLLETGGGLVNALPLLGDAPFFTRNSDSFWIDSVTPNLERMADAWDDDKMDGLLLLAPACDAIGHRGKGDFLMSPAGALTRRPDRETAPFIYAGATIYHPRFLEGAPDGPFSLNLLFDRAIENGRLFGLRLEGIWMDVGTPDAVQKAEYALNTML